jgi:hypothetical protein
MHANQELMELAYQSIIMQSDAPKFWEYRKSSNPNHKMINVMSFDALRDVFIEEGIEGLQTYEFLKPVYIQKYNDIVGVPDINNLGIRQSNDKIIIISGFNIYDILTTYHLQSLNKFDTALKLLEKNYTNEKNNSAVVNSFMAIVLLFCIILTMLINNYVVALMKEENEECLEINNTENKSK